MYTYIYVRLGLDIYTICISHVEWPKRRLSNKKCCSCLNAFNAGNISVRWVFSSTPFYRWESWGSESEVSTNRKRKSWDLTPGHILTTCNLSSPDSTCVAAMKELMQVKGPAGCLGHSRCFRNVDARLMWAAPHSATPGGLQESKGYERQEGWVSAVLIPCGGDRATRAKRHPLPCSPSSPSTHFWPNTWLNFKISIWLELAYPSSLNELLHILLYWIYGWKKTQHFVKQFKLSWRWYY